eukprot:6487025-Amphidinium_carterae.1
MPTFQRPAYPPSAASKGQSAPTQSAALATVIETDFSDFALCAVVREQGSTNTCLTVQSALLSVPAGHGVIDTACSKCLIGSDNIDRYAKALSERSNGRLKPRRIQVKPVQYEGLSGPATSTDEALEWPVQLGKKRGKMITTVVPGKVPLLISKPQLKEMNAVVRLSNKSGDKLSVFGEDIPVTCENNGLLTVDLFSFAAFVSVYKQLPSPELDYDDDVNMHESEMIDAKTRAPVQHIPINDNTDPEFGMSVIVDKEKRIHLSNCVADFSRALQGCQGGEVKFDHPKLDSLLDMFDIAGQLIFVHLAWKPKNMRKLPATTRQALLSQHSSTMRMSRHAFTKHGENWYHAVDAVNINDGAKPCPSGAELMLTLIELAGAKRERVVGNAQPAMPDFSTSVGFTTTIASADRDCKERSVSTRGATQNTTSTTLPTGVRTEASELVYVMDCVPSMQSATAPEAFVSDRTAMVLPSTPVQSTQLSSVATSEYSSSKCFTSSAVDSTYHRKVSIHGRGDSNQTEGSANRTGGNEETNRQTDRGSSFAEGHDQSTASRSGSLSCQHEAGDTTTTAGCANIDNTDASVMACKVKTCECGYVVQHCGFPASSTIKYSEDELYSILARRDSHQHTL